MRMSFSPEELSLGTELLVELENSDPLTYPRDGVSDRPLDHEYEAHRIAALVHFAAAQRDVTVHTMIHSRGDCVVEISKKPIPFEGEEKNPASRFA